MFDGLLKISINFWCTWKNNLLGTIEITSIIISWASEYLFLSNAQFLQLKGNILPWDGIFRPECIVVPSILMAVTPVAASNRTRTLSGLPL